jgi:hypothetical protein
LIQVAIDSELVVFTVLVGHSVPLFLLAKGWHAAEPPFQHGPHIDIPHFGLSGRIMGSLLVGPQHLLEYFFRVLVDGSSVERIKKALIQIV